MEEGIPRKKLLFSGICIMVFVGAEIVFEVLNKSSNTLSVVLTITSSIAFSVIGVIAIVFAFLNVKRLRKHK